MYDVGSYNKTMPERIPKKKRRKDAIAKAAKTGKTDGVEAHNQYKREHPLLFEDLPQANGLDEKEFVLLNKLYSVIKSFVSFKKFSIILRFFICGFFYQNYRQITYNHKNNSKNYF